MFGIDPDDLLLETAVGEPMHPGIQDGDLLLLDGSENRFRTFGIYVLPPAQTAEIRVIGRVLWTCGPPRGSR